MAQVMRHNRQLPGPTPDLHIPVPISLGQPARARDARPTAASLRPLVDAASRECAARLLTDPVDVPAWLTLLQAVAPYLESAVLTAVNEAWEDEWTRVAGAGFRYEVELYERVRQSLSALDRLHLDGAQLTRARLGEGLN